MAKKRKRSRLIPIVLLSVILALGVYLALRVLFPIQYVDLIKMESEKYEIDPYLIVSVIHTESRFKSEARSIKDAQGLMQITESTWTWAIEKMKQEAKDWNVCTPEDNLEVGVWYLNYLKINFASHDEQVVLAAYNAGEGNVRKWLANTDYSTDGMTLHTIPFPETAAYILKVERTEKIYKALYPDIFKD